MSDLNPSSKRVVHYSKLGFCEVGSPAIVFPLDHPTCSNTNFVKTREVLAFDKNTGVFETEKTIYKPTATAVQV